MQIDRPKISEQDIENIEPYVSSSSWEEQMSSSSPYAEPEMQRAVSMPYVQSPMIISSVAQPVVAARPVVAAQPVAAAQPAPVVPLRKKSSKKISALPSYASPSYLSPALERIPTPYPPQTKWTPPPAYISEQDALEPTARPIRVFGEEKEDLSNRI